MNCYNLVLPCIPITVLVKHFDEFNSVCFESIKLKIKQILKQLLKGHQPIVLPPKKSHRPVVHRPVVCRPVVYRPIVHRPIVRAPIFKYAQTAYEVHLQNHKNKVVD